MNNGWVIPYILVCAAMQTKTGMTKIFKSKVYTAQTMLLTVKKPSCSLIIWYIELDSFLGDMTYSNSPYNAEA